MNSATSSVTIDKMRSTFASHGLPEIVVSDNGSNFVSSEFKSFLQKNGIKHITSAPYQTNSNGLVERAVQTFTQGMKKQGDGSVDTKLARFVLSYCITPQSTTGESPAQLLWGRSLRSHFDLPRPDVATRVHLAQSRQKKQHDQHSRTRGVKLGDAVSVRKYSWGSKWVPGTIIQETGPLSTRVELEDGMVVRRHHDQLISPFTEPLCPSLTAQRAGHSKEGSLVLEVAVPDVNSLEVTCRELESPTTPEDPSLVPAIPVRRYPVRDRRPPQRYY